MGFKGFLKGIFDEEVPEENEVQQAPVVQEQEKAAPKAAAAEKPAQQTPAAQPKQQSVASVLSSALELKVVKPESFSAVGQIADHLLNNRTVVLNLESTNKDNARRIVDFLNGVAYSIDGDIKLVSANTYIITPCSVNMSGEALADSASEGENADNAQETPSSDYSFGSF